MRIVAMTIDDYGSFIELLRQTPEMVIREVDSREAVARYLERNPGLSFLAWKDHRVVGCAMCGHDAVAAGRREERSDRNPPRDPLCRAHRPSA